MDSNLFWCIIGIAGGAIASTLISLFFHFKGLNRKRLTYSVQTFCIVSNKINQVKGLEVKYNSNEIENLFSSTITIKNIGNSIIEKNDFAPSHPLSLLTSGHFIADKSNGVELLPLNHANNVFPLFYTNDNICNRITIDFDYISKKEKITCILFHTKNDIFLDGTLKDGKIVNPITNKKHRIIINIISKMILTFILIIMFSIAISQLNSVFMIIILLLEILVEILNYIGNKIYEI